MPIIRCADLTAQSADSVVLVCCQVVPGFVPRQRSNQRLPVTVDIVDDLGQQISGQHAELPCIVQLLPAAQDAQVFASSTCLTAQACASRTGTAPVTDDSWPGTSEPVAAHCLCFLPNLPQLVCIRCGGWGTDSSHCVSQVSSSNFLKSADQCLHHILTGTGVGSDLVVTVVSGNRTLTTSGQTRVAAFNGSAVFTGLTVRAPTEVCLARVCCYPRSSGVWQCCYVCIARSSCSATSPS
jgi:uncharacterized protein (DUF1501 family)